MVVGGSTNLIRYLRTYWRSILAVVLIVFLVEIVNDHVRIHRTVLSISAIGLMVAALSIFLVFRVNEAYARWWEARTLWGGIVNDSRSFGRQVTSLVDGDNAAAVKRLVYRQVAWVNALRLSLRRQDDWDQLAPFLEPDELEQVKSDVNVPTQLLQRQAEDLTRLADAGALDRVNRLPIEHSLTALSNHQGACERIRNTAFPDRVAYLTRATAWVLAVFLPVALIDDSNYFDVVDMVVVPLFAIAFVLIEQSGAELKDPFENQPNDTPMTALCRTIEIDLRQQLGETDLPKPIEPVDGVLM